MSKTWVGLVFLASLPGCLELDVEIELKRDGSGSQKLELRLPQRVIGVLEASAAALDASGQRPDPMRAFDEAAVKQEMRTNGLSLVSYRSEADAVAREVELEIGFPRLGKLTGSGLFGGAGEWYVLAGRNAGGVRVVCYPQGYARWKSAREQAHRMRRDPDPMLTQIFERKRREIAGLDVRFRLRLPGDVDYHSRNLTKLGARVIETRVRASDIKTGADLVEALAPRFEVEFRGEHCQVKFDESEPLLDELKRHGR